MAGHNEMLIGAAFALSIIAIVAVGTFGAYAMLRGSNTAPITQEGGQFITISASGVAYGYPDQGVVYVVANATGKNASAAIANLSQTITELNSTIQPFINGNTSKLKTQMYSILAIPNSTLYSAYESVEVTILNMANVSPAIAALAQVNNLGIQTVQAGLSATQFSALLNGSLEDAVANATSQAKSVAGNGATVVIQNISIQGGIYYGLADSAAPLASKAGGTFFAGTTYVIRNIYASFKVER